MFEGFTARRIQVAEDVRLRVRVGGDGPPVVLLHGHPRTHTTWHAAAVLLVATGHTVVCPDLRGYGRSTAPPPRTDHAQASKRALATDVLELMKRLQHERFSVVDHDRGSYVAFRLAMDHPEAVDRLAVLDSVPIGAALARADARFAAAWWHWFFAAQHEIRERVITADPEAWYGTGPQRAANMGEGNYADLPCRHPGPRRRPGDARGLPGGTGRRPRCGRRGPGRRPSPGLPDSGGLVHR